jgi:hypothetical protein
VMTDRAFRRLTHTMPQVAERIREECRRRGVSASA